MLVLFAGTRGGAATLFVDAAASGSNDGSSWTDAYVDLQPALAAAGAGDEIWVARGTYRPTTTGDRVVTFQLRDGVALYGGFRGGETDLGQRDVARNETVLSGDVGVLGDQLDNAIHVVTGAVAATLDGFTVTGGYSDIFPLYHGGGLASARETFVRNCIFRDNFALYSGGAIDEAGDVERCTFERNRSDGYGGAVHEARSLVDCRFQANEAPVGGAVTLFRSARVDRCVFDGNTATSLAGALRISTVGGRVTQCTFTGNSAPTGGAALLRGVSVVGCTFDGNSAADDGGALYGGELSLVDSTFVRNSADTGGAIYLDNYPSEIDSASFDRNVASQGGGAIFAGSNATLAITNAIVRGADAIAGPGPRTIVYSNVEGGPAGNGNIDDDPLFVDPAGGDLRLLPGSPCIDAGSSAELPADVVDLDEDGDVGEPIPYDIAGAPRAVDDLGAPDTGAGPPPVVDMGAYERTTSMAAGEVVGPGPGEPNENRVRIYDESGAPTSVDFLAYSAGHWGTNVASGAVNGGAVAELLTGPGPGAIFGPHVRGFHADGSPMAKLSFFAYGTLRRGVNVASGDVDGDGFDEVLSGPGPGDVFGPHVRGFDVDGATPTSLAKISFFAYATLRYGVLVCSGDVEHDLYQEIVTGAGPGPTFSATVRGFDFDGSIVVPIAKIDFWAFATGAYGANVGSGTVDADAFDEIGSAPGPGPTPIFEARFRGFGYDGAAVTALPGFDVLVFPGLAYGGLLGFGDVQGTGEEALLAGAGPDPRADSTVLRLHYDGAGLSTLTGSFTPFGAAAHGVNVAGAAR